MISSEEDEHQRLNKIEDWRITVHNAKEICLTWHDQWFAEHAQWYVQYTAHIYWMDKQGMKMMMNLLVHTVVNNAVRRLRSVLQQCWWEWWTDDQQYWPATEQIEETDDVDVTVSFNCKSKLVLLLRLGYLKPFLTGSKKTRQGPECRVGALCISRCWFYLTVVAGPKLIQKYYKIIWCCVLLCYGSWWFKCLWYVNDEVKDVYEMIMKLVE